MAVREIKYRGLKKFQIFSGEMRQVWIYGFFLKRGTYGDPSPQAHIFVYENGYEGYRVDASTIGQFTGFLDSQGREIYEDDIVSYEDGMRGVVSFHRGSFVVHAIHRRSRKMLSRIPQESIQVIGNRFENPQLLTNEVQTIVENERAASSAVSATSEAS